MDEHAVGEPAQSPDSGQTHGQGAPGALPAAGPTSSPGQFGAPEFGAPQTMPAWVGSQQVRAGSAWAPEVLDSAAPSAWSVLPAEADGHGPARGGRHGRKVLVAGVTAAAVLFAGGAYAAWSHLNGGGPQPADVLPASTVAFAEVDLDPSVAQKLALYNLLRKFPSTSGLRSTDKDFGDWLVRRLSEGGSTGDALDFGKDVQPWLGKRFAIAAVPAPAGSAGGGSSIDGVVVVQETDQKAAAAAMDKLRSHGSPHLGYAFADGYLVVTPDSTQAAARAVQGAAGAPLASAGTFASDVASLGSDQVVTAWMDATKTGQLIKDQMGSLPGVGAGQLDTMLGQTWRGRWALGVHATGDAVEMRIRTFGSGSPTKPAAPVQIRHVVPDAFAVLAVSGAGPSVADSWRRAASMPTYSALAAQAAAAGLRLPDDLEALLGDQLTVSMGGDPTQQPVVLAAATSGHPDAGKTVLDKLLTLAGPDAVARLGISTQVDGNTLYVGSSAKAVAAGRSGAAASAVTGSDLFKAAVADPAHAQAVVYVDLAKLWSTLQASGTQPPSPEVLHLKAVGLSAVTTSDGSDVTLRVVVG